MSGASASVPDSPYWPNPNPNPNRNQCAFILLCACPFRPHHHAHAPVPRLLPPGHGGQLSPCCNRVERPHPKGSGDMAGHFLPLYCLLPLDCPCIALVSLLIAFVSPLSRLCITPTVLPTIAYHCQPLPTIVYSHTYRNNPTQARTRTLTPTNPFCCFIAEERGKRIRVLRGLGQPEPGFGWGANGVDHQVLGE